jgi:hypothetical protein
MIEAKRSKLILNCESSEAKHSYSQKSNLRSEANWFILKLYNIEAKLTGSIVILYLKQQQKTKIFRASDGQSLMRKVI